MTGNSNKSYHLLHPCFFHGFNYSVGRKIFINIRNLCFCKVMYLPEVEMICLKVFQ